MFSKDTGKIIRRMVKVHIILRTVTDIKVIGKMIACMAVVITTLETETHFRVNGIKTDKMVQVCKYLLMEVDMREILKMG